MAVGSCQELSLVPFVLILRLELWILKLHHFILLVLGQLADSHFLLLV
jgi:hypothetical protein